VDARTVARLAKEDGMLPRRTVECGMTRRLVVLVLVAALTSAHPAGARRWLAGMLTNGAYWGLVEVRRPNFHHSDAFVKSSFQCHGDACYARVGRFTEDNTHYPSTGSFVFLGHGPRGEAIPVMSCAFSLSSVSDCGYHGTYTCDSPSALRSGEILFTDVGCHYVDSGDD
jgi:hypothetical protein